MRARETQRQPNNLPTEGPPKVQKNLDRTEECTLFKDLNARDIRALAVQFTEWGRRRSGVLAYPLHRYSPSSSALPRLRKTAPSRYEPCRLEHIHFRIDIPKRLHLMSAEAIL
jgi:hypothetical protein